MLGGAFAPPKSVRPNKIFWIQCACPSQTLCARRHLPPRRPSVDSLAIQRATPNSFKMPRAAKTRKEESEEPGSDVVMDEAPTSHQPEDDMSVDQDENDEAEDEEIEEEEEVQRVRLVCFRYAGSYIYKGVVDANETTSSLAQHLPLPRLSSSTKVIPWGMRSDTSS